MKKAKIVLTVIAVLAIIGGTFAFKASRLPHQFFKTGVNGLCTLPVNIQYSTDPGLAIDPKPIFTNQYYKIAVAQVGCPFTTYFLAE